MLSILERKHVRVRTDTLYFSMQARYSSGTKRGRSTTGTPLKSENMTRYKPPRTWKSGMPVIVTSRFVALYTLTETNWVMLATMFRCESSTPLLRPVVPAAVRSQSCPVSNAEIVPELKWMSAVASDASSSKRSGMQGTGVQSSLSKLTHSLGMYSDGASLFGTMMMTRRLISSSECPKDRSVSSASGIADGCAKIWTASLTLIACASSCFEKTGFARTQVMPAAACQRTLSGRISN